MDNRHLAHLFEIWDGYWLPGDRAGYSRDVVMTLLFEVADGLTLHRDQGYFVVATQLESGTILINEISEASKDAEKSYFRSVARNMDFELRRSLHPENEDLPQILYFGFLSRTKIKLKHRLDYEDISKIINGGSVIHQRVTGDYVVKRITDPEDSQTLYELVYQPLKSGYGRIVTFYRYTERY